MRILLDTNILIPLEDEILNQDIAEISRISNNNKCILLFHPSSLKDLNKDRDVKRRKITLSKIQKYCPLECPPTPSLEFMNVLNENLKKENDVIDNELLFAVYQNCVDILVTEDKGIHKKAKKVGIDSRVYSIDQYIGFIKGLFERKSIVLPNIEEAYLYNLTKNDPIFDAIKEDYPGFNTWFDKASREGRKAWVVFKDNGHLGAVCVFKEESNEGLISYPIKKLLKLCTFKVALKGRKIGELLLKAAFQYCVENGIEGTYLTLFPKKQQSLLNLCEEFGFLDVPYKNGEQAYYKLFITPPERETEKLSPLEYNIKYYPHYKKDDSVRKFIVPIMPRYHSLIFPDFAKQLRLFYPNDAVNNGIMKAYICHSRTKSILPGDLLLFYKSQNLKKVTSLGIVEKVIRSNNPEEIAATVGKRTVYSFEEIQEICVNEALVILFRQICHFKNPVSFHFLAEQNIIKNHLETITKIDNKDFDLLLSELKRKSN